MTRLERIGVITAILAVVVPAGITSAVYVDSRYAKSDSLELVADRENKRYEEYLRSQQDGINNQMQQWIDRTGKQKPPSFIKQQQRQLDYKRCLYERDVLKIRRTCTQ